MRIVLALAPGLVLALAAAPALADPAPWATGASAAAQPGASALPANPKPEDPVLAFYPAKARADGVEGKAVISCTRTQHLRLDACTLVSEDPPGDGFGQAALDMAARSPDNPKIVETDPKLAAPTQLTIAFSLHPPGISPDVTQAAHMRTPPQVITRPTDAQIQAAYPARAFDQEVEGEALIDCGVTLEGQLERCQIYAEGPTGFGFGQAALDLAYEFRAKPGVIDGEAMPGVPIRVGIQFAPQAADAPLAVKAPDHQTIPDQAPPAWPEGGPGGPAGGRNGSIGGASGPPPSGATPLP